jgi:hypothetical protein
VNLEPGLIVVQILVVLERVELLGCVGIFGHVLAPGHLYWLGKHRPPWNQTWQLAHQKEAEQRRYLAGCQP